MVLHIPLLPVARPRWVALGLAYGAAVATGTALLIALFAPVADGAAQVTPAEEAMQKATESALVSPRGPVLANMDIE